jgi:hypothetical protein
MLILILILKIKIKIKEIVIVIVVYFVCCLVYILCYEMVLVVLCVVCTSMVRDVGWMNATC